MSRELQTLNEQNKLALWADRINACRSSGRTVKDWCKESGICEQTNSRTATPKSALGKALNYLKDGRLEISNNRAERSIKPFVIDRKNFLFANTSKGATGSAVMFSMFLNLLFYDCLALQRPRFSSSGKRRKNCIIHTAICIWISAMEKANEHLGNGWTFPRKTMISKSAGSFGPADLSWLEVV